MSIFEAIVIAVVEGITEFLPVSSTAHMVLTAAMFGIEKDEFVKLFIVVIQLGAILSVVWLYTKRFFQNIDFYLKLLVGFIPAVIFGLLLKHQIDALLENVTVIGFTLLIGGIVMLFIDKWFIKNEEKENTEAEKITFSKALIIGVFQCFAMVPGVSRSAASIVGGLTQKLNRKTAAEFSFFLAVPTMFAATCKDLLDNKDLLLSNTQHFYLLAIGLVVSFLVAVVAIKYFISILTKYGFKIFGIYRIIVGLIVLALVFTGKNLSIID
jgi:undecaprenyl-diphosphatase